MPSSSAACSHGVILSWQQLQAGGSDSSALLVYAHWSVPAMLCCDNSNNEQELSGWKQSRLLSQQHHRPISGLLGTVLDGLPPGPGLTEQLLVEHSKAAAAEREPWGCLTPAITWAGSELTGHFHEQIIGQNTSYSFTQCPRGPGSAVCWQRGAWKIGANISIHCYGVLLGRG